jgi:Fic family protein
VQATLAELTQAVRKYGMEKQQVPKDLNELVAAGYLTAVPAAPAGKKFAIGKKMEVYLAD